MVEDGMNPFLSPKFCEEASWPKEFNNKKMPMLEQKSLIKCNRAAYITMPIVRLQNQSIPMLARKDVAQE